MSFCVSEINKDVNPIIRKLGISTILRPNLSETIPIIGCETIPNRYSNDIYKPNFDDENSNVLDKYIGRNVMTANLDILISELETITDKAWWLVNISFMLAT